MRDAVKKRRRWVRWTAMVLGLVVVVLLLVPLWFPWVLSPALSGLGVAYASYERLGWGRLALNDVSYSHKGLDVEAGRLEVDMPWVLLWDHGKAEEFSVATGVSESAGQLSIQDWRVRWQRHEKPPGEASSKPRIDSLAALLDGAAKIQPMVLDWLHAASASNGVIELPWETLNVDWVRWDQGRLGAGIRASGFPAQVNIRAEWTRETPYRLDLSVPEYETAVEATLDRAEDGWEVAGEAVWQGQTMQFTNRFGGGSWLPSRAHWVAREVEISEPQIPLPEGMTLGFDGTMDWRDERFEFEGRLQVRPGEEAMDWQPPVDLAWRVTGGLRGGQLERMRLEVPWGHVTLPEPVSVEWSKQWLGGPMAFETALDLDSLPEPMDLTGTLSGEIELEPTSGLWPEAGLVLTNTGLRAWRWEGETFRLEARADRERIRLDTLTWEGEEGARVEASAEYAFESQSLVSGRWAAEGPVWKPIFPEEIRMETFAARGMAEGPWTNLAHKGEASWGRLQVPGVRVLDGGIRWRGDARSLEHWEADVRHGESVLAAEGRMAWGEVREGIRGMDVELRTLDWRRDETNLYALAEPARVIVGTSLEEPVDNGGERAGEGTFILQVEPWRWEGAGRHVRVEGRMRWPQRGRWEAEWQGVAVSDLGDWLALPDAEVRLESGHVGVTWDGAPAEYELALKAEYEWAGRRPLRLSVNLDGDGTGVRVGLLEVFDGENRVMSAGGTLPIQLVPSQAPQWAQVLEEDPIDVSFAMRRAEDWWDLLAEKTGVRVEDPAVTLTLAGTMTRPEGVLSARANRVAYVNGHTNVTWPSVDGLVLELAMDASDAYLRRGEFSVLGQEIALAGRLPLGDGFWQGLVRQDRAWTLPWDEAVAEVRMDRAQVSELGRDFTDLISPQGSLSGHLTLRPGLELSGALRMTNISTRAFPPMGPVRDIRGLVTVSNWTVRVASLQGDLGGHKVHVRGFAEAAPGGVTNFNVRLWGTNVPLARQPGLVLRSDLDLQLRPATNGLAELQGEVVLRDSLFLQNLQELLPGNIERPSQRPPYFSLDVEPLRDWLLNVRVRGERFLQIRSPVFRGRISTTMRLEGTMGQPLALGTVRVDEGLVQFPFATLEVDQGLVTLTSENPYQPELLIAASGQNYGYRVRLDVEGSAADPILIFSSSPPLRSEEIILMMTAGEVPQDAYRHTGTQKTGRAAMFLGKDLLNRLSNDRTAAERLSIRSGEHVSRQGDLTYTIEYKLNDRWSLVGEYDRFNALNAGLKWRIYSK